MHFPYERLSRTLTITENTQGHTYSANMVGIPMTIDFARMRRERIVLMVAGPARHEMHVTGAHPADGPDVRLDFSTTRSWAGSQTSTFLFLKMSRMGTPIADAGKYRTEVAHRHACGLSVYRVKVRGNESAADLWKRVDRVAPRMCAGPSVGFTVGSADYDDVAVVGPGYSLVPGAANVSTTPRTVLIRPRSYWSAIFENLVLTVMTNAIQADRIYWPETAAGAAAGSSGAGREDDDAAGSGGTEGEDGSEESAWEVMEEDEVVDAEDE